jgi:TRAP-type C4-dicarboxylate transport system substrate-binding protein
MRVHRLAVLGLLLFGAQARAEPVTLRISLVAPDGSPWAREMRTFEREVSDDTRGEVKVKPLFGAVAGDDFESFGKMQRGELEGVVSAGMLCEHLSPSMRALRLLGLFHSREEVEYVRGRLRDLFDAEFARAHTVNLGLSGLGPALLFSRTPLHTMADLRRSKVWVWDIDRLGRLYADAVGIDPVALPITRVSSSLEEGKIDAVFAVPTAVLAYQWETRLKYLADIRTTWLTACMVIDQRIYDHVSTDGQRALRAAAERLAARLDRVGRTVDDEVLKQFREHGMQSLNVPESLRNELFAEYQKARISLGGELVPLPLQRRVVALLTAFRARAGSR